MIKVENVNKSYGKKNVLKNITLTLESGQIVGLLGPDGSGKSTLLKILSGHLKDYNGMVQILGEEVSDKSKGKVAFLAENPMINDDWKLKKILNYVEDFFEDFNREKAEELLKKFKLDNNMRIKTMSKGMQEKLSIALMMGREAPIYLLDEPLGGVDPAARTNILKNILSSFNPESLMVISTHLISDVEAILDSVIFLKDQELFRQSEAEALREREGMSIDDYFRRLYSEEASCL